MSGHDSAVRIVRVEDPALAQAVYAFRYEVFTLEQGDWRYVVEGERIYRDEDDGPNCHLFAALDEADRVVGTIRLTLLRDREFLGLPAYQLPRLAEFLGLNEQQLRAIVARCDRGAVAVEQRGRGLFRRLHETVDNAARDLHGRYLVGSTDVESPAGHAANLAVGYEATPFFGTHNRRTCNVIIKRLFS